MGTMITLKAADGFSLGAYDVKPEGKARGGVVLIQEIFGVNPHIKRVCEGYAMDGYHVIAPAIFDRAERDVELTYEKPDIDRGIALRARIPLEDTVLDVAAAIDALKAEGRVAIVGFCFGGSMAWIAGARVPGLSAAIGYYGGMVSKHLDEQPACPVMLHYGEKDQGIPLADVEKIRAATDPAKVQIFTYPAGHAFNREGNHAYEPHSAMLARMRTGKLLAETVG
ncbi:MAG TPA: dienelactone hydrolase family protein [Bauldia sp.]|nr:dienelactone hydrolase family protein [Bauldia sp.]